MPHASDIGDPIADAAGFGAALKPSISSSANLVGGLLASVILFSDFFEGNAFGGASIVVAVMGAVIARLLIWWYAWKLPRTDRLVKRIE